MIDSIDYNNITYLRRYFIISLFVFIAVCLYYALFGYKDSVKEYMEIGRFITTFYSVVFLGCTFTNIKANNLFLANALFFLVIVVWLKISYSVSGLDVFANSKDSYIYFNFTYQNGDLPIADFFKKLTQTTSADRSDYGFYSVIYFLYNIYPDKNFIIYGVIVIDTLFLWLSSMYLYRLAMLLSKSDRISKLVSLLFCASPYLVVIAANGLKEVIFSSIVIISFYYIIKTQEKFTWLNLALSVVFIFLCIFFRSAISYILALMLITSLTVREEYKKKYLIAILSLFALTGILLPIVLSMLNELSVDALIYTANARIAETKESQSIYVKFAPIISGILGPFPIVDRTGEFAFISSYTVYVKCSLGLFFSYGIYKIIKKQDIRYFSILVFLFYSIYMTIITGVSFDIRYHVTYLPLFFIVAMNFVKKKPALDYSYLAFAVILIFIYSTRNLR